MRPDAIARPGSGLPGSEAAEAATRAGTAIAAAHEGEDRRDHEEDPVQQDNYQSWVPQERYPILRRRSGYGRDVKCADSPLKGAKGGPGRQKLVRAHAEDDGRTEAAGEDGDEASEVEERGQAVERDGDDRMVHRLHEGDGRDQVDEDEDGPERDEEHEVVLGGGAIISDLVEAITVGIVEGRDGCNGR